MALRDVTLPALNESTGGLLSLLSDADAAWAVRVGGALDAGTCQAMSRAVLEARADWVADFPPAGDRDARRATQFTLGRAWYAHLEQERASDYFAKAAATDALVERVLPGMQARVRQRMSACVGEAVVPRRGWCGPGVHVFPAGEKVARVGGDLHFDDEGLTEAALRDRLPALSFVLMLQPPEEGGAIRIWNAIHEGAAQPTAAMVAQPHVDVPYRTGDLVIFSSYRLHQIQPFAGTLDRISVTAHALRVAGEWVTWF
jgi:hypothetical protein